MKGVRGHPLSLIRPNCSGIPSETSRVALAPTLVSSVRAICLSKKIAQPLPPSPLLRGNHPFLLRFAFLAHVWQPTVRPGSAPWDGWSTGAAMSSGGAPSAEKAAGLTGDALLRAKGEAGLAKRKYTNLIKAHMDQKRGGRPRDDPEIEKAYRGALAASVRLRGATEAECAAVCDFTRSLKEVLAAGEAPLAKAEVELEDLNAAKIARECEAEEAAAAAAAKTEG
eukprot:TRINITY_DN9954_c0_g2_i1.p1 TRINITY_DN9954_c0_g2~~TRINITY_DN9954_c0_g2_i1.p1  ORF type:complete len:225 (+),score=20.27 TRINITY_DN9954_c0_g2_i1:1001-1675(+)